MSNFVYGNSLIKSYSHSNRKMYFENQNFLCGITHSVYTHHHTSRSIRKYFQNHLIQSKLCIFIANNIQKISIKPNRYISHSYSWAKKNLFMVPAYQIRNNTQLLFANTNTVWLSMMEKHE